jgi:LysR family transcriptional activator of dmlA
MELADLRVFLRIAELKSISATAKSLVQPKSAISRALGRLEREVGALLIDRGGRHARLTDVGSTSYPHAKQLLAAAGKRRRP